MKKLYYKIVNDAYYKIKYGPSPELWKLGLIIVMALPQVLFFIWIIAVIEKHTFIFYELPLIKNFLSNNTFANLIETILLYIIPFLLINYYLILYKEKYKKILNENNYKNGVYVKYYWMILIIPIILHLLSWLF